jgi:hypothetical protein
MPITPAPTTTVGRQDDLAVGGHPGRGRRAGADRHHDVGRGDLPPAVPAVHHHGVRIREGADPPQELDVVPAELVLHDLDLPAADLLDPGEQHLGAHARCRDPAPVLRAAGEAREEHDGLAEGLAGDGAGVDADAADAALLLDDRRALAELGRLDRRPLAGGPAPDADEVELVARRHPEAPAR